jgi:hypothetical protein
VTVSYHGFGFSYLRFLFTTVGTSSGAIGCNSASGKDIDDELEFDGMKKIKKST